MVRIRLTPPNVITTFRVRWMEHHIGGRHFERSGPSSCASSVRLVAPLIASMQNRKQLAGGGGSSTRYILRISPAHCYSGERSDTVLHSKELYNDHRHGDEADCEFPPVGRGIIRGRASASPHTGGKAFVPSPPSVGI